MKNKVRIVLAAFAVVMTLDGCGEDPVLSQFKDDIDDFCTKISEIDTSINSIDAESEYAISELLGYLDDLDGVFQSFAALDFPEEFDYLENLADESSQYMTEAVQSFHEAYSNGSYNEYTADFARQNYSRAYKRIQIIIAFLHGEEPDDADLVIEYNNNNE